MLAPFLDESLVPKGATVYEFNPRSLAPHVHLNAHALSEVRPSSLSCLIPFPSLLEESFFHEIESNIREKRSNKTFTSGNKLASKVCSRAASKCRVTVIE